MSSESEQIATAYHEAGHAVMALVQGRPVHRVSIAPNHLRLGACEYQKGTFRPAKDQLEREILISLSGMVAEARKTGHYDLQGASRDLRNVRWLAQKRASGEPQIERLERRLLNKTEHILEDRAHWKAVERIAEELIRLTTLSGRAAQHLFNEALSQAAREK